MIAKYMKLIRAQNWNRTPASISRGLSALVDLPKFGDVITPDGLTEIRPVERVGHVDEDVDVRPRHATAGPGGPDEEGLRQVEVDLVEGRAPLAEPLTAWRAIVDFVSLLSSLPVVMV